MTNSSVEDELPAQRYTTFVVGRGIALVTETTLFLLDPSNGPLAEQAWALMQAGASSDELLEAISATGLRSLGSFALAQVEHDDDRSAVRVVARGDGVVDVDTAGSTRTLTAAGVRTWLEDVIPYEGSIALRLGEVELEGVPFRIGTGLVPAVAVGRTLTPTAPALCDVELPTGDDLEDLVPAVAPVAATAADPAADGTAPAAAASPPADPVSQAAAPDPTASDPTIPPGAPAGLAAASATTAAPSPPPPPPPAAEAGSDPAATPVVSTPASIDPRATIGRADAEDLLGAGGSISTTEQASDYDYDAIYGRTMMRSVSDAAVHRPPDADHEADGADGMIAGVPQQGAPTGSGPNPSAVGDHDGRTVSRAQLQAMRAAGAASPAQQPSGPTLQAVLCASGHPNPPHVAQCRVCGLLVGTAGRTVIPRPALGRLRFGDGTEVVLDRPALIGRNPRIEGQFTNELPQVVRLDLGQGLSRTHAAVRLEGWQVYLEDLNSANGTVLTLPGRAPRRLHAGEPALVEHGSMVDFGGEVTCTFEEA